jgi:hypothetical protein
LPSGKSSNRAGRFARPPWPSRISGLTPAPFDDCGAPGNPLQDGPVKPEAGADEPLKNMKEWRWMQSIPNPSLSDQFSANREIITEFYKNRFDRFQGVVALT